MAEAPLEKCSCEFEMKSIMSRRYFNIIHHLSRGSVDTAYEEAKKIGSIDAPFLRKLGCLPAEDALLRASVWAKEALDAITKKGE